MLWYVLENYLKALHPFMPFITERIWQSIPHEGESIVIADFPELCSCLIDHEAEDKIKIISGVISEIRKIRSELKINPAKSILVSLKTDDDSKKELLVDNIRYICSLAKVSGVEFKDCNQEKGYIKTTTENVDIFIYILDVVDVELEVKRLKDRIKKVELDAEKSRKKISNIDFINKAPAGIVKKEKDKLKELEKILVVLSEQLARIENII
jgi:valyl-tRNA synthetase